LERENIIQAKELILYLLKMNDFKEKVLKAIYHFNIYIGTYTSNQIQHGRQLRFIF